MQHELKEIADLALFAKIVQAGGISQCAKRVGLERTTISRRLRELERSLGVRLLDRNSRHLIVTDAGRLCFEQCAQLLDIAQNVRSLGNAGNAVNMPVTATVAGPPDLFEYVLEPLLREFLQKRDLMRIDRRPEPLFNGHDSTQFDLAFSWRPDAGCETAPKKVCSFPQSIFASREYLVSRGTPESPSDLHQHVCAVDTKTATGRKWEFVDGGRRMTVKIRGPYNVAGPLEAREWAQAGLGLCKLPNFLCDQLVRAGQLVRILRDFVVEPQDLYMFISESSTMDPAIANLRVFLEDRFRRSPSQG